MSNKFKGVFLPKAFRCLAMSPDRPDDWEDYGNGFCVAPTLQWNETLKTYCVVSPNSNPFAVAPAISIHVYEITRSVHSRKGSRNLTIHYSEVHQRHFIRVAPYEEIYVEPGGDFYYVIGRPKAAKYWQLEAEKIRQKNTRLEDIPWVGVST